MNRMIVINRALKRVSKAHEVFRETTSLHEYRALKRVSKAHEVFRKTTSLHEVGEITLIELFYQIAKHEVKGLYIEDVRDYIYNANPYDSAVEWLLDSDVVDAIGALFKNELFKIFYEEEDGYPERYEESISIEDLVKEAWMCIIFEREDVVEWLIKELKLKR